MDGWYSPDATFDLRGLTPVEAEAILGQWALTQAIRRRRGRLGRRHWVEFMEQYAVDRNQLYTFLNGSRPAQFGVVISLFLHWPHFPDRAAVVELLADVRRRSERYTKGRESERG